MLFGGHACWRADFPFVGQGFIPCRRIFYRRGVKPRPTLSQFFISVGQPIF